MKIDNQYTRVIKRGLLVSLTTIMIAGLSTTAMGRGGGGRHGGEGSDDRGGRHSGEGFDDHGGSHSGENHQLRGGHHGSIVRDLPSGHREIEHRGNHYLFHEGRFFDRHRDGFIVISAPLGIVVPSLPVSAVRLSVGGLTIFATDNNYYRQIPDGFVVVESPYR